MAPAGIISSVPGAGGRAALFAAARWVSPRPSTASLGPATAGVVSPLRPMGRIAAAAPGVGGLGAYIARRSGLLHSAMGTAPRLEVAAGGFGGRFSAASSGSLRLAAAAAPPDALLPLRRGARLPPSAGKSDGTPAREGVEGTPAPTPRKGLLSRLAELGAKLLQEGQKSTFTLFLLLVAIAIGSLAASKFPGSTFAGGIVNVCEKADKFYKFAAHFVPFAILVINYFRGN